MYKANAARYDGIDYVRCGKSGLKLPKVSIGLWQNFGFQADFDVAKEMLKAAFDLGVTHFDLANNYGPPYGSAEENFGKIFLEDFKPYRDELILSTKAGYDMWAGPYGNNGSKKYLTASLDQSLRRMKVDYVDIFYHHRPDKDTPIEETALALDLMVRQGKALYIGISNYGAEDTEKISKIFRELRTPFIIHQARYSLLDRHVENGLTDVLKNEGLGLIAFSPLAQGMLSEKYLSGEVSNGTRAAENRTLKKQQIDENLEKVKKLEAIARGRGEKLSQMAIGWLINQGVTSVLCGTSSVSQVIENVKAADNCKFSLEELRQIDSITNN